MMVCALAETTILQDMFEQKHVLCALLRENNYSTHKISDNSYNSQHLVNMKPQKHPEWCLQLLYKPRAVLYG